METRSLICRANQWTGFYMIGTSVMKELKITLSASPHTHTIHIHSLLL